MKNQTSHNKVLILGAICLSILAGVFSYKIAEIKNQQDLNKPQSSGIFNITADNNAKNKVNNAIDGSDSTLDNLVDSQDPFTITDKDSATTKLAKQVYSDYVDQEAGNSDLSAADIAQNALAQLSPADMPQAKYNLNDITFTKQENVENIRLYGNNFAEIFKRNMSIIANDQDKYSSNLTAMADIYQKMSRELLNIQVPAGISSSHLAIINNYQIMADSFRLIDVQSQDPVKSLLGVRAAKSASDDNDQMFTNISKYFNNNGIIFGNNEVGSIWNSN